MDELARSLCASPELFPYSLDGRRDLLTLIRLDEPSYASASFLDARILTSHTSVRVLPFAEAAAAVERGNLVESCAYIFHIGHVGSTLLSRLIGAHPRVFSLREPALLRVFAHGMPEADFVPLGAPACEARLSVCLRLWSRTFRPHQQAVVKATSFVSEIAASLMSRPMAPRAVLMCTSPESYLATVFGGENSRREAKLLAPARLARLHHRIGYDAWRLDRLSEGEWVALGWACEMAALAAASRASGDRAHVLDFDEFLARPATHLSAVLRHLGIAGTASDVEAISQGVEMRRYSKAPEHAYDAALRSEVLDQARCLRGAEIRRGLAWIDAAARSFDVVRAGLECWHNGAAV